MISGDHWLCGQCGKECVVIHEKTACCSHRTVWHYSEAQWVARLVRERRVFESKKEAARLKRITGR